MDMGAQLAQPSVVTVSLQARGEDSWRYINLLFEDSELLVGASPVSSISSKTGAVTWPSFCRCIVTWCSHWLIITHR